MKKNKWDLKKLQLSRETLRVLEKVDVRQAAGGEAPQSCESGRPCCDPTCLPSETQ
jgi:hypothetical protein